MSKIKSSINWYGGKYYLANKIVPLMPPHELYLEPFAGGLHVLFAKRPSKIEIVNDIHSDLIHLYQILRDRYTAKALLRQLEYTLHSREEFYDARIRYKEEQDPIKRAALFYYTLKNAFSGNIGDRLPSFSDSIISPPAYSYRNSLKNLLRMHQRLRYVSIENLGWERFLDKYTTPEAVVYADPPYPLCTRIGNDRYDYEMTDQAHERLLDCLIQIPCAVLLSSYPNPIYEKLSAHGWEKKEFTAFCCAAGRTRETGLKGDGSAPKRTEALWLNPKCLKRLSRRYRLCEE